MRMARRNVLAGLAALGAGMPARAQLGGKSIAVIGAGMAGLAAAGTLTRAGADVTLYEARKRIGGRVYTSTVWTDLPCDLGASWIHGPRGNPITKIAKAAGARMVETRYASAMAFEGADEAQDGSDPWDLAEAARDMAWDLPKDLSLREAMLLLPDLAGLSAREQTGLAALIHRAIEHEYGGDWGQLSARYFDAGKTFSGTDVLFPDGFGAVAAYAARGLTIKTGAEVTRIAPSEKGVQLGFASGQSIFADHAIITLPLGVLQSGRVDFAAPLAAQRQTAIETLGMGLLNKVFLRFADRPPTPAVDWLEKLDAPAHSFPEWINLAHITGAAALLGFNAAASADEIEQFSDRDTIAAATQALRAMFGSSFPAPLGAQITRWRADPFARGAYSYHRKGARKKARLDLFGTDWDGRIVFAGEAASPDYPQTVHGAWLSGIDAAAEV